MTSNGTTYFLTSATTTSAQQNSYMEDFNDAEQDWFLDEDQQAQPVGTPTGDDFSALFNVPIDDTFFGEATSGLDVQNIAPDPQTDQFSQGSSVVVQPGQAPYQPYGSEAGPSGYSQPPLQQMQNQQFETLQPYDPCQPAAPQGQYNPSGQQLQQPYTSSTNLNHTSSTEFDLSAAAELAAAFENQRSDGLPSYERPMQSGTYVPECQPSTSSANQFGHAGKQQGWMGGVQGMEMAGGMAVSHQQYGQASGYRIVQREDGQQIAYVDQQQEMLTEMGGQYVNAAAQNEGGYNPVQVMHPHTNSTNMPPHILQQNQNQPSFHSMPPQTLISGSQPPPQLMSNGPDMLSNPNNASNQARRMPAPKTAAKKAAPARQAPNSTTSSFASATLGSVMEKIFANTGDMNAAVRFTPEKSAEFGQILCQYNSLMAEQEATGMDLSMQIKSVEERIVALLSVAEPTSQTTMAQPFPSTAQPNPCIPPQTQTTSKPPAKSKWRKKPAQAKQDPPLTTPTPSKPFNAPPRQQEIAAIIQMDPNNMTSLTPQQLAQLLPGHLTTGANGQPVTVLLDYGPAGQQQIQLQTLPVTPVLEPSRKAPTKKPQSGKNGIDGTLDDTIDQVVGHQQPLYVYNPPNGTPAENSTSAAVKVPPKRKSRAKAAIAQAKNSGQPINVRPITPPPPPVILPSPAELGKKIEERRIRRKENVSKEFDILLDSLAEEDCEKPFTSKSDCIQRVLPFAFSYEPEMSQNLLEQFDHEMLRHSVSIMERRNELETKMRSILFRDALGEDAYNHELSMLLHLDCEYERRTLTKEKELAANDPSSFVPDPYLLQSATNPVASEENHQLPSTSSMHSSENTKIASPAAPIAMDFDYHDFDPQDYLNRIFNLVLPASPKTPSPLPSSEDEEEILPIQDPELQTSSRREENKDSVDPPTEMASPLQENDLQPILETHYMKSPELFTNFNLRSPVHEPEEVVKWQEESAQEVFRNIDQGQNHNLVGINQVFGRPEAVENDTFEASTSQNWSFEHNSLSHLPPKLRLTRARLQLPLVQALDNGTRSLNEGEKLKPLEQTVGSSLEMSTALSNDAGKEMKFDLESTEGDGADENLRGLDQQIAEQVVERNLEEVEEKAQDQQECKLQPLKIKLNRNPVKSPLTLSNNTAQLPEKESKEDRKRRKKKKNGRKSGSSTFSDPPQMPKKATKAQKKPQ